MGNIEVQSCSWSFSYWMVVTYHLLLGRDMGVGLSATGWYGGYKWAGHAPLQMIRMRIHLPWLRGQAFEHKAFQVQHNQSSNNEVHFSQPSMSQILWCITPGTTLISYTSTLFQICMYNSLPLARLPYLLKWCSFYSRLRPSDMSSSKS